MKEIFNVDNILLNASFDNKWDAIKTAGNILVENGYVTEEYIDDMVKREQIISTYVGNNVSIPHGVDESKNKIITSGISFIQVPEGVDFYENNKVYIIVGIAGKNDEHIEMLSKIALVCSDMQNIEKLKTAKTKESVLAVFENMNNFDQ